MRKNHEAVFSVLLLFCSSKSSYSPWYPVLDTDIYLCSLLDVRDEVSNPHTRKGEDYSFGLF